ncbi:MAG TPA: hypothetical protein VFT16_03415 [Candidatus Saccharimonadales bacterium]|nr:hypothetical protein [Candidatus Saccharimonadales bacterium]
MSILGKIRNKADSRSKKSDSRLRSWNKAIWIFDGIAAYTASVHFSLIWATKTWAILGTGFYVFMSMLGFVAAVTLVIGCVLRLKRWSNYNYGAVRLLMIPLLLIIAWFAFGYSTEYIQAAWNFSDFG